MARTQFNQNHPVSIEDFAACVNEQAEFLASQNGRELVGTVSVAQVRNHYEHGVSVDATALDLISDGVV